jgi:hypothetical protein
MTGSLRLIRRILETETAYSLSRLERLQALTGNSLGLAWRQLDAGAIAQMARHRPLPAYNRVLGLRADLAAELAPVLAWYKAAGVKAELETVAAYTDADLVGELVRRGYFQSGFRVLLAGRPRPPPAARPDLAVEKITSAARLEEVCARPGDAVGSAAGAELKAQYRAAFAAAGAALYCGATQGLAAAAVLFRHEGIGLCAPAALSPARQGLDVAPFAAALADAAAARLEWVCLEADLASAAQRQLLGFGLTVASVRALWTQV